MDSSTMQCLTEIVSKRNNKKGDGDCKEEYGREPCPNRKTAENVRLNMRKHHSVTKGYSALDP